MLYENKRHSRALFHLRANGMLFSREKLLCSWDTIILRIGIFIRRCSNSIFCSYSCTMSRVQSLHSVCMCAYVSTCCCSINTWCATVKHVRMKVPIEHQSAYNALGFVSHSHTGVRNRVNRATYRHQTYILYIPRTHCIHKHRNQMPSLARNVQVQGAFLE